MPTHTFHFLNVKNGDCSIIEHGSGHVSVIDVCNAEKITQTFTEKSRVLGNFQQNKHPVNPIEYLNKFTSSRVFRFILTHPDMDHMDGIKDFFEHFNPINFWDTDNEKELDFEEDSKYNEEDWNFYKNIRDSNSQTDPKRLVLYSGDKGKYWAQDTNGQIPGDALYILSPTSGLIEQAKDKDDYNDASYVILYSGQGGRILLSGDSHDKTWEHILENWEDYVKDVDLLIAPHHGRHSDMNFQFLDTVNPKMTFFGIAPSDNLAYAAWNNRKLEKITNNQANCMVVDCSGNNLSLYVTNESFARAYTKENNSDTSYSDEYDAWFLKEITGWDLKD
ncbi:MAG: hypothetical protein OXM61_19455 [Candidatus Poribacteria bacterium]|nr:hypothetical protein [Candidatus Poribacteria bacterium]